MRRELVVATKNKKKLREIRAILKGMRVKLISMDVYPEAPEVIENGRTFRANAAKKALQIAAYTGKPAMGEDSGLCVQALHGAPGVRSARFSGKEKSDLKNNRKLLGLMEGLPESRRSAMYVCAIAIAVPGCLIGQVQGDCRGKIGRQMLGNSGFGYDPVFVIPKFRKTFAQLGPRVKHKMSHRYKALLKARRILEKYFSKKAS